MRLGNSASRPSWSRVGLRHERPRFMRRSDASVFGFRDQGRDGEPGQTDDAPQPSSLSSLGYTPLALVFRRTAEPPLPSETPAAVQSVDQTSVSLALRLNVILQVRDRIVSAVKSAAMVSPSPPGTGQPARNVIINRRPTTRLLRTTIVNRLVDGAPWPAKPVPAVDQNMPGQPITTIEQFYSTPGLGDEVDLGLRQAPPEMASNTAPSARPARVRHLRTGRRLSPPPTSGGVQHSRPVRLGWSQTTVPAIPNLNPTVEVFDDWQPVHRTTRRRLAETHTSLIERALAKTVETWDVSRVDRVYRAERVETQSSAVLAPTGPPMAQPSNTAPSIDLNRLDNELWNRFEKRIRIERERRGKA